MKKIPTVLVRDPEDRAHVLPAITPGCEWVLTPHATARRKWDGTCVMYDGEHWFARREVKPGKIPPEGWVEVQHDRLTGKRVGWQPIAASPFARFHREAMEPDSWAHCAAGTYELIGPKINGNPEGPRRHELVEHAEAQRVPSGLARASADDLLAMVARLGSQGWEGVVWSHPDGRMAKMKARDIPTRQEQP